MAFTIKLEIFPLSTVHFFSENMSKTTRTGALAPTEWKNPEEFHLFSKLKFGRNFWFDLDPGDSRTDWINFLDIPDE